MGASMPRKGENASEGDDQRSGLHTAGEGKLIWREKAIALRWSSSGSPRRASHPTLSDLCSVLKQCGIGSQGASCDHHSSPRWAAPPRPPRPHKAGFSLLQSPSIVVVSPRYAYTGCRPSIILGMDTLRPIVPQRTSMSTRLGHVARDMRPHTVSKI
jgi:hypothetical protein